MAAPKNFGGVSLSASTPANVFQGPSAGASFSVTVVNRNAGTATVRLGFSETSATLDNGNLIEYDVTIPPNGVLERTGLVIEDNTYYFVAESDVTSVNVTAYGWEA